MNLRIRARASQWPAALAIGLAGLIGVGAVAAVAARSAASPFDLVFSGQHEPMPTSDNTLSDCGIRARSRQARRSVHREQPSISTSSAPIVEIEPFVSTRAPTAAAA